MQKHILLFLVIVLIAACSPKSEEGFFSKASTNTGLTCQNDDTVEEKSRDFTIKAIYGEDNRLDWFESPGKTKDYWAKSTLALIPNSNLVLREDDYVINASTYKYTVNLCDGQPFEYQPSAAFCSGFLVADDIIITAGHCIRNQNDCDSTNFVFDFAKTSPNQTEYRIPISSVYSCESIIESQTGNSDFAVVRLDRPVEDRTPLNVRRAGSVSRGDQVMLVGHPMGLPSKIADGGFVQSVGNTISASVDAFAANSGSVILNSVSGIVEGILVAGEVDFTYEGGCRKEAQCGGNCDGEVITPISKVLSFIPETNYANPICSNE